MSFLGVIYNSLSGLASFTKGLDNLSNNIANLNTPGFKQSELLFNELLGEQNAGARGGGGVEVAGSQLNFAQGDTAETGNATDVAIEGDGFFVLQGDGQQFYTRSGRFNFDADGYLIDPITGFRVAGISDSDELQDINFQDFRLSEAEATTRVEFTGTFDANVAVGETITEDAAGDPFEVTFFDAAGSEQVVRLQYTRLAGSRIEVTITNEDGSPLMNSAVIDFSTLGSPLNETGNITLNYEPFTVNDDDAYEDGFEVAGTLNVEHDQENTAEDASETALANAGLFSVVTEDQQIVLRDELSNRFVTDAQLRFDVDGFLVDNTTSERLAARNDAGVLVDFNVSELINNPAIPTTTVTLTGVLDRALAVGESFPADADADPQSFTVVETDGDERTLRYGFARRDADRWELSVTDEENNVIDTADVRFDDDGVIQSSSERVSITIPGQGGTVQALSINLIDAEADTQLRVEDGAVASITASGIDGRETGEITEARFDENGVLQLTYDNGETASGPRIALVTRSEQSIEGVELDFSQTNFLSTAGTRVTVEEVDGRTVGQLTELVFDEDGELNATYSNEDEQSIAQLALAHFDNLNSLESVGEALFRADSGTRVILGRAREGSFGEIRPNSIELSNVELSQEFADIIIVQRGYQASSQVLNVTNEMIEELYNTVRGR